MSNPGNTEAHTAPAPTPDANPFKEQPFDELLKLFSEVEKSKDPNMCAKMATELENALSKFKNLSVALVAQPTMEPNKAEVKGGQDTHESTIKHESSSQSVVPNTKSGNKKVMGKKNPKASTSASKPSTQRNSKAHQPPQNGREESQR